MENKPVKSYRDLRVYQNLYRAQILVLTKIIPNLPKEEKYDLGDQMRRACKAGPALIAEGFAKRYQKKNWQKYISDTTGECNEMINHLSVSIDVYSDYVDREYARKRSISMIKAAVNYIILAKVGKIFIGLISDF
jgi:four helix bundle protein